MPAYWIRWSGYNSLRADDPDPRPDLRGVLQRGQPAAARDRVGVEQHDIVARVRRAQTAVDVRREAPIVSRRHDPDPVDAPERGQMLGARGIVRDDDPHRAARGRAPDPAHELCDQLGVAVAGDHDRHRPAMAPVPAAGVCGPVRRCGVEPQQRLQRREAQRERRRPVGELRAGRGACRSATPAAGRRSAARASRAAHRCGLSRTGSSRSLAARPARARTSVSPSSAVAWRSAAAW